MTKSDVVLHGWWVELPTRAEAFVERFAKDRGWEATAGRAQAELYLVRRDRLEKELARLEKGEKPHRLLARALQAQDLVRGGDAAEALPHLEALAKERGELGQWASLRAAEVLGRQGRIDEARARLGAPRSDDEPPVLRALVEARLAQRGGRRDEAERILEGVTGDLPRAAAPLVAMYHRARAILLSLANDDARALMHHRLAVDVLKELGDRFLLTKEYLSLGQTYVEGAELDVAEYFFQRARALASELGSDRLSGLLASRLGLLALARGDLAAAREHFETDLQLASAAGLRHAAAHARKNVGRVRVKSGDVRTGVVLLAEAKNAFEALGDTLNANLVELDELAARIPKASDAILARLEAIDRFFADAARDEMRARVAAVKAELLAATGRTVLAREALDEACRVFRRFHRKDVAVEATLAVANRLEAAGERESALELLRRAHQEALEAGVVGAVAAIVERIGRIDERAVMELAADGAEDPALKPVSSGPWYQESLERSRSPAIRRLIEDAHAIAATDETVLILGETGTGKELLARSIHELGRRRGATFIAVNCGAIPDGLLESELFGHARGAFTGAERRRLGIFEAADGGCVFLDEIGELSPRGQVTLLRFLEDRRVRPVGTNVARPVDVRILAATNRDLLAEAREGRFRIDLYFRLAVFPLAIPPLRARLEDLELLARTLLGNVPLAQEKGIRTIAADALAALRRHDWPGNLRELDNVLRAASIRAKGRRLERRDLALSERATDLGDGDFPTLDELEKRHLVTALDRTEGNQIRAAELLGIHRNTLATKMRKYGIEE